MYSPVSLIEGMVADVLGVQHPIQHCVKRPRKREDEFLAQRGGL